MQLPVLENFCLVGGTSLALKYGHRLSVDLDLFTSSEELKREEILNVLENEFGHDFLFDGNNSQWAIFCYINNVQVDLVNFPHPLLKSVDQTDNIRFYSSEDICAMKITAIPGRGKKKDFWDLYELLHHFSLAEIINFHRQKYPRQMLLISVPQAVTYFLDAEESEEPVSLKGQKWTDVKDFIQQHVKKYLK